MNADEILKRATEGLLTAPEQEAVSQALRGKAGGQDRYTLLLALGRAMAKQHRETVESFLDYEDDPMLARLALQILCKFWSETDNYIDYVKRALDGLAWDEDEDVRQMALSAAGEYLRDHQEAALLEKLISIVEDENDDELTRADAYISLARAMGKEWAELPKLSRLPPLEELITVAVLDAARKRLAIENAVAQK